MCLYSDIICENSLYDFTFHPLIIFTHLYYSFKDMHRANKTYLLTVMYIMIYCTLGITVS